MPELDWQRYLERRALTPVAPLDAVLAVLGMLLRRAFALLRAGLPAFLVGLLWLLFRDELTAFADRPGSAFVWPLLLLAGDFVCLCMLVAFATEVARGLLTAQPIAALPRLDRAELRSALAGLPAVLAAGAALLVLRLPFADWHPMLFLLGERAAGPFFGRLLLAALPVCLLLAVVAPLLPAAALGPGLRGPAFRAVARSSWAANLAVALLGLGLFLLALLLVREISLALYQTGTQRLLIALALPALSLLGVAVLQTGFALVFARCIGWTSGPVAAT